MDTKIKDIQIFQDKQVKYLRFNTSNPSEQDSTNTVFEALSKGSHQIDEGGIKWQQVHENLACRLVSDNGKALFEFKEISTNNNTVQSSALLLVPIIMLDKEIISEEQKDLFHQTLRSDPLIQLQQEKLPRQDDLNMLSKSAQEIFGKSPYKK